MPSSPSLHFEFFDKFITCLFNLFAILQYRHYEDMLLRYKSWCMVWIIICIVPFGMLVIESGLNLNWAYMAAQVFIAPFITPLFLTIGWAGAKSQALIAGRIYCVLYANAHDS